MEAVERIPAQAHWHEQDWDDSLVTEQAKPRRRSTKTEQRAEMIEQILDEADYLFSRHGLYGVTLKDVAKRVGVHHTLLNYYFDDKKNPIEAVFSKLKRLLRKANERSVETTWRRIGKLLDHFPPNECANYSRSAGYASI